MSWSRASRLSMEKSGSSGASGRWGKAMVVVTRAAGWRKEPALQSETTRASPFRSKHRLRKSPPKGPSLQLLSRNEWPATPQADRGGLGGTSSQAGSHRVPTRPLLLHSADQRDFGPLLQPLHGRENLASRQEKRLPGPPGSPVRSSDARRNRKETASWKGHLKTSGNASPFQSHCRLEAGVSVIKLRFS